ncbi:hypothetical protein [Neoaquamicrobium microcysteis]|jgi:hypothetical protein|uniref:hypothetical protein n=1 Tax=Neoaquamicrobium microcysteis TaxID=2682781 RepID=UPI001375E5D0|nr:hypothetical protein [Mesorhizobium microcysteis]
MLARRFTIVCLLVSVFGMMLSVLVAEDSRANHVRGTGFLSCDANGCGLPARR